MSKKILNLGSGRRLFKDALNVDMVDVGHPNFIRSDILDFLEENSFLEEWDEIHLHYVLEHFDLQEVEQILYRCWEGLKCNGKLVILTDDFDALIEKYLTIKQNEDGLRAYMSIHYNLFCAEDSTYHKVCFNQDLLEFMLKQQGFEIEKIMRGVGSLGTSMLVIACKVCRGKSERELLHNLGIQLESGNHV